MRVVWLITQRSRVQIPPLLPRPEALSRTEKGPLACGLLADLLTGPVLKPSRSGGDRRPRRQGRWKLANRDDQLRECIGDQLAPHHTRAGAASGQRVNSSLCRFRSGSGRGRRPGSDKARFVEVRTLLDSVGWVYLPTAASACVFRVGRERSKCLAWRLRPVRISSELEVR
jgi:hypothetical protein